MRERAEEPSLFDLSPVTPAGEPEAGDDGSSRPEAEAATGRSARERSRAPGGTPPRDVDDELPLFPDPEDEGGATIRGHAPEPAGADRRPAAEPRLPEPPSPEPGASEPPPLALHRPTRVPQPARFGARLLAALADLGVHALAAAVVWAGAALAGARLGAADLPALAVFLLAFSFLYSVVSLAFWGQTPGMAAAGVIARGDGDQPLTFGQTGLRWLAALLTLLLAGLPLLLALTGRSLPDRLSGTRTHDAR